MNALHVSHPTPRGFTLVELLVASTVTVLVAGSAMLIFQSVTAAQERVERQTALQQEARGAIRAIADALRSAYPPPEDADEEEEDEGWLEGTDDRIGDAPADRIRFFTADRRTIRLGQPESDVREVEFFLAPAEEGRLPALMVRIDPTRNVQPDGGGVIERVADNVIALDIEYNDGEVWLERWPESQRMWPTAVRVRLVVAAEDRDRPRLQQVSRLINFPTARSMEDDAEGEESL